MRKKSSYPAERIVKFYSITGHLDKNDNIVVITGTSVLTDKFEITIEKTKDVPKPTSGNWNEGCYTILGKNCYYRVSVSIGKTIRDDGWYSDDDSPSPLDDVDYYDHGIPAYVYSASIGSVVTLI
jgi:hypothetical protein